MIDAVLFPSCENTETIVVPLLIPVISPVLDTVATFDIAEVHDIVLFVAFDGTIVETA